MLNQTEQNYNLKKIDIDTKFIPYNLLLNTILINTDIPQEIIEEINSELFYKTLHGNGNLNLTSLNYKGHIKYGILDSRIFNYKYITRKNNIFSTKKLKKNNEIPENIETISEIEFKDGTKYIGTIHNNIIEGKGKFFFPTGSTYEGEVKECLRDGYGKYENIKEKISYEGYWKKGLKHGYGKLKKPNLLYEGNFKNGIINGEGKIKWLKTNNYYNGNFVNNLCEGFGFMIWKKKNYYQKYTGNFEKNIQNGFGINVYYEFTKKNYNKMFRNRYIGEWKDGKREGFGIMFYFNGEEFIGFWKNNKKNGFGIFYFIDRSYIKCIFEDDRIKEIKEFKSNFLLNDENNNIDYTKVNSNKNLRNINLPDNKIDNNNDDENYYPNFYFNIDDISQYSPEIKNYFFDIDKIILLSISDILRIYKNISNKEKDYNDNSIMSTNLIKRIETEEKFDNINYELSLTNDNYFCLELKDLWIFLRDTVGIINKNFTFAFFDRFFFNNFYINSFNIPNELLNKKNNKEIYDYIKDLFNQFKYEVFCKNNIGENKKLYDKKIIYNNIHNKKNIILLNQFHEVLIRIAYYKYELDDVNFYENYIGEIPNFIKKKDLKFPEKLKNIISNIKPFLKIKHKSIISSKINELSTISSHNSTKVFNNKKLIDNFLDIYEIILEKCFNDLYYLYTFNPNESDKTLTYLIFYNHIIKNNIKEIKNLFPNLISFCELILNIPNKILIPVNLNTTKKSMILIKEEIEKNKEQLTTENIHQKDNKFYIQLLNNEIIFYEFCEIIYYICKKYYELNANINLNKNKDECYDFIIYNIKKNIRKTILYYKYKKSKKIGKNYYFYPKTKKQINIEKNVKLNEEIKLKIEKEKREKERIEKQRKMMELDDVNIFQENNSIVQSYEESEDENYD